MANVLSPSFFAAWQSIKVNDVLNDNTRIEDIQVNKIVAVFPTTTLYNGAEVDVLCFQVKSESQLQRVDEYLFLLNDFPIATVFAELSALLPEDLFESYDAWTKFNYTPFAEAKPLVLGAAHVQRKQFVPADSSTDIYVDLGNALAKAIYTVEGVATISEEEYEEYYG